MKKMLVVAGFLVGLSSINVYGCDMGITSVVDVNAPHYSLQSFNLALLSESTVTASMSDDAMINVTLPTGEVQEHGMDSIYRYIMSFDTFETMQDYSKYQDITFDNTLLDYMQDNWNTNYYFEVTDNE